MDPAGSQRRERKDVQRNLERILQAAHELFAESGPDVKMEAVARRAGVGVATIYRRFPSKEELFAAVRSAACDHTRHCLAQAAADVHTPLEKIRAVVIAHYRQGAHLAALLELDAPSDDSGAGPSAPTGFYTTLHDLLTPLIHAGQQQGTIRPGDPALLAAICLELLSPRACRHLTQHLPPDAAAEHVAAFVVAGLSWEGVRREA
jgi:AcrR family transcriptional regulator